MTHGYKRVIKCDVRWKREEHMKACPPFLKRKSGKRWTEWPLVFHPSRPASAARPRLQSIVWHARRHWWQRGNWVHQVGGDDHLGVVEPARVNKICSHFLKYSKIILHNITIWSGNKKQPIFDESKYRSDFQVPFSRWTLWVYRINMTLFFGALTKKPLFHLAAQCTCCFQ